MNIDLDGQMPSSLAPVASYVAIGDSFTQGPCCPAEGRWADRLAAALRVANPDLRYLNLAVEGAGSDQVLLQVEEATAVRPELASVTCGVNDVLMSVRPDIEGYARNVNSMVDRLVAANPGVVIVTATVPSRWQSLEVRPRTKRRVIESLKALNERTREIVSERRLALVDVERHPSLHEAGNFAPDGLHPSELGHERTSHEFMRVVGEAFAALRGRSARIQSNLPNRDQERAI